MFNFTSTLRSQNKEHVEKAVIVDCLFEYPALQYKYRLAESCLFSEGNKNVKEAL